MVVDKLRELKGINTSFDYGVELVVMAVKQNINIDELENDLSNLFEMDKVCKKGFLLAKETIYKINNNMISNISIEDIFTFYYDGETNFMTPNIIGYDYKKFGEEYLLIEYSMGEGLKGETIYGASALEFNICDYTIRKIELSECYYNKKDLNQHLKNIDYNVFSKANKYGEIKKWGF